MDCWKVIFNIIIGILMKLSPSTFRLDEVLMLTYSLDVNNLFESYRNPFGWVLCLYLSLPVYYNFEGFFVLKERNSVVVQWLGLDSFTAMGLVSVHNWVTKIPLATWCCQKRKKRHIYLQSLYPKIGKLRFYIQV